MGARGGKYAIPRPLLAGIIVLLGMFALGLRLFQLQIVMSAEYDALADRNRVSKVPLQASRGLITDRNGKILAKNNLQSSVFYIVSGDRSADTLNVDKLSAFLGIHPTDELRKKVIEADPDDVVLIQENLPKTVVINLEERAISFPRTIIETVADRSYPYGRLAAHVVGYVGRMSSDEYREFKLLGYMPDETVGKFGVEKMYDSILRGTPGEKKLLVDAPGRSRRVKMRPVKDKFGNELYDDEGRPVLEEDIRKPKKGADLQLTIDIDLQSAITPLLGERRGAVIVMDPNDGSILAMLSSPSFDPNLFGGPIAGVDWNAIASDEGHPLQNRAIQNAYPPGSVVKPATAWAALDDGKVSGRTTVYCNGVFELGTGKFRCWQRWGHGRVDIVTGMAYSCDEYFYYAGYESGAASIASKATALGLGSITGIDLPGEITGRIPDEEWKLNRIGEKWYGGDTINMAIGQGYMQATPIQVARLMAAFANGGHLITPHLTAVFEEHEPAKINIEPAHLDLIRRGIRSAVTLKDGTARALYSLPFTVAAKTGTAQDPPREFPHSWLAAYAPYENPRVLVVSFLENVPTDNPRAVNLTAEILSLDLIQPYISGDIGNPL